MKTLFILNEMKSKQAIPTLIELVKAPKGRPRPEQEKVTSRPPGASSLSACRLMSL